MAKRNADIKIKVENLPGVVEKIELLTAERDEARAALQRVRELAETWRYKGEHGWGPWQEGYGPGPEDEILDHAAGELRKALDGDGTDG